MFKYWRTLTLLLLFLRHVLLYSFNTCICIVAGKHLKATLKIIMSIYSAMGLYVLLDFGQSQIYFYIFMK